jgi:hypothetical protein
MTATISCDYVAIPQQQGSDSVIDLEAIPAVLQTLGI